jgi:hypothetical protein
MATIFDCQASPQSGKIWGTPQYNGIEHVMAVEYDFDKMTGALGDYILGTIPANSIITEVEYILPTAFVGTGDVVTLGLTTTGSAVLATDMAAVGADTLTFGVPVHATANTHIKSTADADIYFTIATAVVTAGRMVAVIRYLTIPAS